VRIIHVTEKINEASGGPARHICQLAMATAATGEATCEILGFDLKHLGKPLPTSPQVPVRLLETPRPYLWGLSWTFTKVLHELARDPEVIFHVHNLWRFPLSAANWIAAHHRRPTMVSTHGALNPYSFSLKGWRKRLPWELMEKPRIHKATVIRATSVSEAQNLAQLFPASPIAIIPVGVDLATFQPPQPRAGPKTALFLSRIVHYKGLMNLIEAWEIVRPRDWSLLIAGPDLEGYRDQCEQAVRERKLQDAIKFTGPLYHELKWRAYSQADLFILPTFTENFGIVVAEALAAGVPVITTTGAPWRDLVEYRCGWWIDIGVEPLVQALREATSLGEGLKEMGERGRKLVLEKYTWPKIAKDIISVYKWMSGKGPWPECMYEP